MKVFLSRDKPSKILADNAKEFGWELTCFSCIEQKLLTSDEPPGADWIFFYSPSSARLYLNNFSRRQYRFGALGNGTANALKESGINPDFLGSFSSPQKSVEEFSWNLKLNETIVQARAEDSFERLKNAISSQQIIDWPFYKTTTKESVPKFVADYYILTSPSNARAYLHHHNFHQQAKIIVFGESTLEVIPKELSSRVAVTEYPGEEHALPLIW